MTAILTAPCISCGLVVFWDRVGTTLRLMQRSAGGRVRRHSCAAACGEWMPLAKDRCARAPGHREGEHRTRDAMDDAARARRKWVA